MANGKKSFLAVNVERSTSHLGDSTGWTKLFNDELSLYIGGGVVNGVEYLDSLQYKRKLENPYNNFVTPFSIFELLTIEGKKFFYDYYQGDFERILNEVNQNVKYCQEKLNDAASIKLGIQNEIMAIKSLLI